MMGAHLRGQLSHKIDWVPVHGVVGWFIISMSGSVLTHAGLEGIRE